MKFKSFIDSDIEDFRKLNIGIVKDSKDELVRKIEEKYGISNETIDLIEDVNILLGKKTKIGFTLTETGSIEKKIKKLNKRKLEAVKLKLFESNSFLSEMKRQLERKLVEDRYYAEVRIMEKGDDIGINNVVYGRTERAAFDNAKYYAKKNLKGSNIKINIIDTQHPKHGEWIISSKKLKV
jgi:hypothetical protein